MKKNHEHFSILSLCDSYFECSNQEVILYTQQSSAWLYGSIFSCLKRRTCLYLVYYVTLYELWSYKKWVVYAMCHTTHDIPLNTLGPSLSGVYTGHIWFACVYIRCPPVYTLGIWCAPVWAWNMPSALPELLHAKGLSPPPSRLL